MVLDPFAGSGTTGSVATGNGRDATLIDLDERNLDLAYDRIGGLFLEVPRNRPGRSSICRRSDVAAAGSRQG